MKKSDLKTMINQGIKLLETHTGIEMVFNFYAGGISILDINNDDDVIALYKTEQECLDCLESMNEEGYNHCYYKPIIIDTNTGRQLTRKTIDHYKK